MKNGLKLNIANLMIVLFLFGVIVLDNGSIEMKVIKLFFVMGAIVYLLMNNTVKFNFYIIWLALFTIYSGLTILWAYSADTAINAMKTVLLNFILLWSFIQLLNEKSERIALSYVLLVFCPILYMLRLLSQYGFGILRVGLRQIEDAPISMHNSIGMYAAFAVCVLFILVKECKGSKRFFFYALIFLNTMLVALSGSRKSILYMLIPLVVCFVLKSKDPKHYIINVMCILLGICAAYLCIMKNTYLYNMVGEGLETMISGILGLEADASTYGRMRIIKWGMETFRGHPILGHGLENFKILHLNAYGSLYIADNNYIELLVDQGIIGLVIYYCFHIVLLYKLYKCRKKDKLNFEINMYIGIEIAILICDYGLVSYRNLYIQILLALIWTGLECRKRNIKSNFGG